jgi:hypothetical protein
MSKFALFWLGKVTLSPLSNEEAEVLRVLTYLLKLELILASLSITPKIKLK